MPWHPPSPSPRKAAPIAHDTLCLASAASMGQDLALAEHPPCTPSKVILDLHPKYPLPQPRDPGESGAAGPAPTLPENSPPPLAASSI